MAPRRAPAAPPPPPAHVAAPPGHPERPDPPPAAPPENVAPAPPGGPSAPSSIADAIRQFRGAVGRGAGPDREDAVAAAVAALERVTREEPPAEWVDLESLTPDPRNPRVNDHVVARVAASIRRFGWGRPILARLADRSVIAGHTAIKAARSLGITRVPVRWMELDPVEARLLNVADNKLGELAEWNEHALAEILRDADAVGGLDDLEPLGFELEEVTELLDSLEEGEGGGAPAPEPDAPEPDQVHSEKGRVYVLGPHRVMCGDSRRPEHLAQLMSGQHAHVLWTDPPYGVEVLGGAKWLPKENRVARGAKVIEGDAAGDDLEGLLREAFAAADTAMLPGCAVYVAHAAKNVRVFVERFEAQWTRRQELIWVKSALVVGHSDYHYRHEPILYGCKPIGAGRWGRGGQGWYGDDAQDTVFEVARPSAKAVDAHPSVKPVELIEPMLRNSSPRGAIVLDIFGGAGSTMLAAARTGRRCFTMEVDPCFVDVIRRRWTRYARLEGIDPGGDSLEPLERNVDGDDDEDDEEG